MVFQFVLLFLQIKMSVTHRTSVCTVVLVLTHQAPTSVCV